MKLALIITVAIVTWTLLMIVVLALMKAAARADRDMELWSVPEPPSHVDQQWRTRPYDFDEDA